MKKKKHNPRKVVVVLSGGMDSTTLLYHHIAMRDIVRAISVDYGQRHRKELLCAEKTCRGLGVPWECADLKGLRVILPGSALTDNAVNVPHGHYEDESMKKTVVPNRNMILLAIALGHGIAHDYGYVSYAAHMGDHAIYPDCRPEFAMAMGRAAALCDWAPMRLLRPFVRMDKARIAALGDSMNVDWSNTWSCYEGGKLHCGKCGTCVERREAFQMASVEDPTIYAA